jgi:hypothetical protein
VNWNELEALVRAQQEPEKKTPLVLGQAVAWISRHNGKADYVSAVHHHYEDGKTFCRLEIPPRIQHLPVLPSLGVCRRCEAMSRRALHIAKLGASVTPMRVSA